MTRKAVAEPTGTWTLWAAGVLRGRYELRDTDNVPVLCFQRRHLDGTPHRVNPRSDEDPIAIRADSETHVAVTAGPSPEPRVEIHGEEIRIAGKTYLFWASRNRTCRAEIFNPHETLLKVSPVRSHSYRPFLQIEAAPGLPDPALAAIATCFLVARDDRRTTGTAAAGMTPN